MSTFGKNKSVIRRTLAEERTPNVVSKTVTWAHKSNGHYTSIDLSTLTVPPEMTSNGFTNPNPLDYPYLRLYRQNLKIESTFKGELKDYVDYTIVGDTRISFLNNLTTEPGEVFIIKLSIPNNVDLDTLQQQLTTGGNSSISLENINFLASSLKAWDAETGTTGWSIYKDPAASRPSDGTGGTGATVTFATTSTNPLVGKSSFLLTKPASNVQGEGVSVDFKIDNAYKAKVLKIEFDYIVNSGTFTAGSTTTDSDLIVYIYDITNNKLIEPTTFKLYSNASNIADRYSGFFQTSADGVDYRLILHIASNTTNAWSLKIDNVRVTPSQHLYGTPITDWTEYTPTFNSGFTVGTGGIAYNKWYWRRVGGDMEIRGSFSLGTTGASMGTGDFTFSLPAGYSLDENRLNGNGTGVNGSEGAKIGTTSCYDAGGGQRDIGNIVRAVSSVNSFFITLLRHDGIPGNINSTFPFTWGANDELHIHSMSVPIQGWSASVKISDGFDSRDIVLVCKGAQNLTGYGTSPQTIKFTVVSDTVAGYNQSTGIYTVPSSGFYNINASVVTNTIINSNDTIYLRLVKNSTVEASTFTRVTSSGNNFSPNILIKTIYCNAGDTLLLEYYSSSTPNFSILNDPNFTYLNICKLQSPQTIAQSEVVAFDARHTAGQSIPHSIDTPVNLNIINLDTHNAYRQGSGYNPTNGTWTTTPAWICQEAGFYQASFATLWANVSWATDIYLDSIIIQYRPGVGEINRASSTTVINAAYVNFATVFTAVGVFQLRAGDELRFLINQTSGTPKNLANFSNITRATIHKIG